MSYGLVELLGHTGVRAIGALLARHFPAAGENPNELPDRPVTL